MKKYLLGLFVFSLLIVPIVSFAEVEDIDPNLPASECVDIINNLRYKDKDVNKNGEVSTLQDFLQVQGYLNSEPTGYLGLLTVKAIKSFQKANDIAPSGYVGPVTRVKIKSITCDTTIPEPTTQKFNGYLSPIINSNTMWGTHTLMVNETDINCNKEVCANSAVGKSYPVKGEGSVFSDLKRYQNSKVTIIGQLSWIELEGGFWGIKAIRVMPINEISTSPIISGVSGPKSLTVNQIGTWIVSAYDKGNGKLSYSVDWGEEGKMVCSTAEGPCSTEQGTQVIIQESERFSHSYAREGVYVPVFTVKNSNGKTAKTSLVIKVGNVVSSPSVKVISPNGGETLIKGEKKVIYWKNSFDSIVSALSASSVMAAPTYYKISLVPYYPPCNSEICPMMAIRAPYLIADKVQTTSYEWNVGDVITNGSAEEVVSNGDYVIQVCKVGTEICDSSDSYFQIKSSETNSGDLTPRIMYWWGKVNQHVDDLGNWQTDPDGISGADLDKLAYCKKWYPNTVRTEDYKLETINSWHNRYNLSSFTSIKMSTKCVQDNSVVGNLDISYDDFAKCLKEKGAIFYGASWCSHCQNQKALFGSSASFLPYVECSNSTTSDQSQVCVEKNIQGYPTWVFADGSSLSGEQTLETLASKTSCVLPK